MALAMSESNRRKEVRAVKPPMAEQPKVIDQEIAQMGPQQMPEDQGIGQLPAGNMDFANGGIIAFADGGDVERYQLGGLFETDPAKLRALAEERLRLEQLRQGRLVASGPYSSLAASAPNPASAGSSGSFLRNLNPAGVAGYGFGLYHGDLNEGEEAELARRRAMPPTITDPKSAAPVAAGTEGRRTAPVGEGVGTNVSPNLIPASARAKAKVGDTAPNKVAAPAAPAAPPGPTQSSEAGIEALKKKYFDPLDQEIGGLRNARVGLASGIAELANNNLAATKADIEKRGDVYKGREERLTKQEKGLEGTSDKYMGLALLQAGAAIMTTPGGISMALGKGIDVGSKQYAVGMEKINAAKEKFAEARDRLDDLRINRDDMNAKDIRAAEKEVREAQLKGQELFYNGLVTDLGVKQKNVTAIFGAAADDLKTTRQIEAERTNTLIRERGASARANAFTPDMREAMLLGTGTTPEEKYLSGLKVKKDLMGDKQGTQLFKMFLEENGRREKNMEQPLTLDQFRRQSAAFFAPPAPVDTGKPTRP